MIESTTLWFVLMTLFATHPIDTPGAQFAPGDVMFSEFLAASDTEAGCKTAASMLAEPLRTPKTGAVYVCVALPESINDSLRFPSIDELIAQGKISAQ